jgi:hypothetical protein
MHTVDKIDCELTQAKFEGTGTIPSPLHQSAQRPAESSEPQSQRTPEGGPWRDRQHDTFAHEALDVPSSPDPSTGRVLARMCTVNYESAVIARGGGASGVSAESPWNAEDPAVRLLRDSKASSRTGPKIHCHGILRNGADAQQTSVCSNTSERTVVADGNAAREVSVDGVGDPGEHLLRKSNASARDGPTIHRHGILRIGGDAQQTWELVTNLAEAEISGENVAGGVPVTAAEAQRLVPGLCEAPLDAAVRWKPPRARGGKQVKALRHLGALPTAFDFVSSSQKSVKAFMAVVNVARRCTSWRQRRGGLCWAFVNRAWIPHCHGRLRRQGRGDSMASSAELPWCVPYNCDLFLLLF